MKLNKSAFLWTIGIIIAIATIVFMIGTLTGKLKIRQDNNTVEKLNSIEEFQNKYKSMNIHIPEELAKVDKAEIRVTMGQFVEIGCEQFVLKVGPLVDMKADTLALYEKIEKDFRFKINNNVISYLRYRYEYPELKNCTLVNWVEQERAYGLIIPSVYEQSEILKLLNIKAEDLQVYTESTEEKEVTNKNVIEIKGKYKISLNKYKTEVKAVEMREKTLFYFGDKIGFVILDKEDNSFESSKTINLKYGFVLKYLEQNPFEEDTQAYNDYNSFVETINTTIDSIEYFMDTEGTEKTTS